MRLRALAAQGLLTATRLYLVRHGQVADGHTDIYNGHNDVDLSAAGVSQCQYLANHLKDVKLAGIYSSDLTRTRRGAEIINEGRGLMVKTVPEFREINFGIWEGLSFQEIMTRYPDELQQRFAWIWQISGYRRERVSRTWRPGWLPGWLILYSNTRARPFWWWPMPGLTG